MTNEEKQLKEKKRRFLLRSVVLSLLPMWTQPRAQPLSDLEKYKISLHEALYVIEVLIHHGLVKEEIRWQNRKIKTTEILKHPQQFREAIVLTSTGDETNREINIQSLFKLWDEVQ
ncbi:MAG: hypothetical protein WCV58_03550 [Patescibacteria group bacterium]